MSEPRLLRRPLPPKDETALLRWKRKDHKVTSAVHPEASGEDTGSKEMPGDSEATANQPSTDMQSHCVILSLPDSIVGRSRTLGYHFSCLNSLWEPGSPSSPPIARDLVIPVQHTGPPSFPLQKRRIPLRLKLPPLKRQLFLPSDFILRGFTTVVCHDLQQRSGSAHEKPAISHYNYEVFSRQLIRELQRSHQMEINTVFLPDQNFIDLAKKSERQALSEKLPGHQLGLSGFSEFLEKAEEEKIPSFQVKEKRRKKKEVSSTARLEDSQFSPHTIEAIICKQASLNPLGSLINHSFCDTASIFDSSELSLVAGVRCKPQSSPDEEKELMTKGEMAVLCCFMHKRTGLSLKGFFLPILPDLSMLADFLLYLNLSFNELHLFPTELCDFVNLQILKLRNNPIKFIPEDIVKMKCLKTLVMSFNLLTELPPWLFMLPNLEYLDASYNELEHISNAIGNARNLSCLILDGNLLWTLPCGLLKINLKRLKVENNFVHPLFWREFRLQPQRLTDMAALCFVQNNLHNRYPELPENIKELLRNCDICDCCSGPLYGRGLHFLRPYKNIFGLRLPYTFSACSPACYSDSAIRTDLNTVDGRPFVDPLCSN